MNYLLSALILGLLVIGLFWLMWSAWRRRTKRDESMLPAGEEITSEPLTSFPRVFYVATTRRNAPLERVSVPGLRYRGYAQVDVHSEGVVMCVSGEPRVTVAVSDIVDVSNAQMRIDKVVERDGLALICWQSGGQLLESSFRLNDAEQQRQFTQTIRGILPENDHHDFTNFQSSGQEA